MRVRVERAGEGESGKPPARFCVAGAQRDGEGLTRRVAKRGDWPGRREKRRVTRRESSYFLSPPPALPRQRTQKVIGRPSGPIRGRFHRGSTPMGPPNCGGRRVDMLPGLAFLRPAEEAQARGLMRP